MKKACAVVATLSVCLVTSFARSEDVSAVAPGQPLDLESAGASVAGVGVGAYLTALKGINGYTFGAGLRGEYRFNDYVGAEARLSVAFADGGTCVPLEAGVFGSYPVKPMELFAGVGGGYYTFNLQDTELSADPLFGLYLTGGARYMIAENIDLFLALRYTRAVGDVSETTLIPGGTRTVTMTYGVDGVGADAGVMVSF